MEIIIINKVNLECLMVHSAEMNVTKKPTTLHGDFIAGNNSFDKPNPEQLLEELNDELANRLIPVIVVLGLLMTIGICGNSLVVYVYWRWAKMKGTTKRVFILTLAHLDLTVCSIAIPFEIYDLRNKADFQNLTACKIGRILEYSMVLASGFVLVSVSVERYVFLCKAYDKFSKRKAQWICVGCVILSLIIGGPSATFAGIKKTKLGGTELYGHECSMDSEDGNSKIAQKIYYYLLSAIFLICVCVLVVIYLIIWSLLRKYQNESLRHTNSVNSLRINRNDLDKELPIDNICVPKETRSGSAESTVTLRRGPGQRKFKSPSSIIVFFSVTVTFLLSFLPHIIVKFLMFFGVHLDEITNKEAGELLYNFFIRSYLVGNVSNPFLYSILNKPFRYELKRCMRRLYQGEKYEHRNTYLVDL